MSNNKDTFEYTTGTEIILRQKLERIANTAEFVSDAIGMVSAHLNAGNSITDAVEALEDLRKTLLIASKDI